MSQKKCSRNANAFSAPKFVSIARYDSALWHHQTTRVRERRTRMQNTRTYEYMYEYIHQTAIFRRSNDVLQKSIALYAKWSMPRLKQCPPAQQNFISLLGPPQCACMCVRVQWDSLNCKIFHFAQVMFVFTVHCPNPLLEYGIL